MKAALWMRVSTDEQTVEHQRPVLEAEARRRGLDIARVWAFDASAWHGDHKPQLKELFAAAAVHEFDVLLVWALDRLDRSGGLEMALAVRRLVASGVRVVSIQEPGLDALLASPFADVFVTFLGVLANMESARKSERQKAWVARRRALGLPVGRQAGAKDLRPRKRSGYVARYEKSK